MGELFNAAVELIADVKAPHPGEELYCPRMRALQGATLEIAKTLLAQLRPPAMSFPPLSGE